MNTDMKKQTAVEWSTDQLGIDGGTMRDKALAMEKEQMIQFTNNYLRQIYEVGEMTIEDFYNETYGGDE